MEKDIVKLEQINVLVYTIPTMSPESDGTLDWDRTTLVLVESEAGGLKGIGYTYANYSTGILIKNILSKLIVGMNVFDIPSIVIKMLQQIRNYGRDGVLSMAISAIETSLWDLKARLLSIPLARLFGLRKDKVLLYGSGGFTNYSEEQMKYQLDLWKSYGIKKIKIKIGRDPEQDLIRVSKVKEYLGDGYELFVDANGAFDKKQALYYGQKFAQLGIVWYEEPVTSDDLVSLRFLSEALNVSVAAGEYGYDLFYFKRMLEAKAIDVLQLDVTRCGGFIEMLRVINISAAFNTPVSTHCAPYLHLHAACAFDVIHMEYFFDHYRIETSLFDGADKPTDGYLSPDFSRPGIGLEFKKNDAERFLIR